MRTIWILLTLLVGLFACPAWSDDEPPAADTPATDAAASDQKAAASDEQPAASTEDAAKADTNEPAADQGSTSGDAADPKAGDAEPSPDAPAKKEEDVTKDEAPPAKEAEPPAKEEASEDAPAATTNTSGEESSSADSLQSERERISYAIGVSIGRGLKRDGADIDAQLVGRGLASAFAGNGVLLSDAEVRDAILAFRRNQKAAAAVSFLEKNSSREGVVKLPSGLQYRVIKEGDGAMPEGSDTVEVHYRGTLTDGREFDSSFKRNKTAEFGVDGVIAGWTEALKLMKVGSKWELVIPPDLAYGDSPPPGSIIGPGDVLVFEVELLGIR